ncbi:hypothetical protein [Xanthobacter autotrophicus]|uniref:hypothetical protein n=1 Tax=Xanthobacter autotrophicus TaxID=280 RepID=UPI00372C6AF3
MTHEEVMGAVEAGAGSHRSSSLYGAGSKYPSTQEVGRFRRQLLITLGDLPEDMTVAELIERLEEHAEAQS